MNSESKGPSDAISSHFVECLELRLVAGFRGGAAGLRSGARPFAGGDGAGRCHASPLGGYETWRATSSYLEVEASRKMAETLLEMLAEVAK